MRLIAIVVSSTALVFALSNRTKAPATPEKATPSNRAARVSMPEKKAILQTMPDGGFNQRPQT